MPPDESQLPLQRRALQLLTLICNGADTDTQRRLSGDDGFVQGRLLFDTALLGWLLDTTDDAACAYWEVLVHLRELGELSGEWGARAATPFLQREMV